MKGETVVVPRHPVIPCCSSAATTQPCAADVGVLKRQRLLPPVRVGQGVPELPEVTPRLPLYRSVAGA